MKYKFGLALGIGIAIAAVVGFAFFLNDSGKFDVIEYVYFVLLLLMLADTAMILWKKSKNIKAGLPVGDELMKKTTWKAGYFFDLFSIWVAVSLLWYNILVPERFGVSELTVEQVIGILVLLPGVFFIGSGMYFNKKGDV